MTRGYDEHLDCMAHEEESAYGEDFDYAGYDEYLDECEVRELMELENWEGCDDFTDECDWSGVADCDDELDEDDYPF